MTWNPISQIAPQYMDANGDPYSGAVLKFYNAGTSVVQNISTNSTGSPTATSVALNSRGFPEVSGNVVIPHIEDNYKVSLYPTQAAADANSGAIWTVDNISIGLGTAASRIINYAADTGSANAYSIAPTPAITAYSTGQFVTLKPANANSGASTINISAVGAKDIKTSTGAALSANMLVTTGIYTLVYDGTNFVLTNPETSSQPLDATLTALAGLATGANKIPYSTGTDTFGQLDFKDEDNMASDSATALPSQQSVKAYVDSLAAAGLTVIGTSTPTGATVDFTSIPTTYRALVLVWHAVSIDTSTRSLQVTANCGAGFGSETCVYKQISGTTVTEVNSGPIFFTNITQTAAQTTSGYVSISGYQSGPRKYFKGIWNAAATATLEWGTGTTTTFEGLITSGTGALEGLRVYIQGSGNFDAGTITLYGVK